MVAKAKERDRQYKEGVSEDASLPTSQLTESSAEKSCFVPLPLDAVCSGEVGVSDRLVFLLIYANISLGKNNLSIRELSEALNIAKSSVSTSINALRNAQWLTWEVPRQGQRQNHYRLLKWQPNCDVPEIGMYQNSVYTENQDIPKIGMCRNPVCTENRDIPKIGECKENLANTEIAKDVPKFGYTGNRYVPESGYTGNRHVPKSGMYRKSGHTENRGV